MPLNVFNTVVLILGLKVGSPLLKNQGETKHLNVAHNIKEGSSWAYLITRKNP